MNTANRNLIARSALPAALVVGIDEAVKTVVRLTMANCTTHDAVGCDYLNVGGVLGILHVENAGSALGFLQGSPVWLMLATLGLLTIPACGRSAKRSGLAVALGVGLMFGATLGNLGDRIIFGSVTDFIVLADQIVINAADVALAAGMVLLTRAIWGARSGSRVRIQELGTTAAGLIQY